MHAPVNWNNGDACVYGVTSTIHTDLVLCNHYLARHNTLCLYNKLPSLILNDPYINLLLLNDGHNFLKLRKICLSAGVMWHSRTKLYHSL